MAFAPNIDKTNKRKKNAEYGEKCMYTLVWFMITSIGLVLMCLFPNPIAYSITYDKYEDMIQNSYCVTHMCNDKCIRHHAQGGCAQHSKKFATI